MGAAGDDANGTDAGAAFVFVRSGTTWGYQQKLNPSDGLSSLDYFGGLVSLSGDTAMVPAWGDDNPRGVDAGSVYIFVRSGTVWSQQAKLTASDGDRFGCRPSLSGDMAMVGSYTNDSANGTDAGAAYIFLRDGTTWTEHQKLIASDGEASDQFGSAAAVKGDMAVVGARYDDDRDTNAGAVYIFEHLDSLPIPEPSTIALLLLAALFGLACVLRHRRA
ncbi:FG-GAP repeat protein [Planctomycetota bacterium]